MFAFLNVLGRLKWPSLLAVTVVPVACFFTTWGAWNRGLTNALYGPEVLAGIPVVLAHRSGVDPLADEEVEWIVRTCAGCGVQVATVDLAYAGCSVAPSAWTSAFGDGDRVSAHVVRPALDRSQAVCMWMGIRTKDGEHGQYQWRLASGAPRRPADVP